MAATSSGWKYWVLCLLVIGAVRFYVMEHATEAPPPLHVIPPPILAPRSTTAAPTLTPTQRPAPTTASAPATQSPAQSAPEGCEAPAPPPSEGGTSTAADPGPDLGTTSHRDYQWEYGGSTWTWSIDLYDETYQAYRERPRTAHAGAWSDYAIYATDPYSQPLVHDLACVLQRTVRSEGMTDSDGVRMALAFVQSLPYTTDLATAGFDDYPRYPLETLYANGGDCEDTSILFTAIVKEMGFGAVMLGLDATPQHSGHVMAAVKGTSLAGTYYTYLGERYYTAETTGEGYRIGQMPPAMANDRATIIPLVAKAKLAGLTFTVGPSADGVTTYTVTLRNDGSEDARNLRIVMGYEASATTMWSKTEWSEGDTLAVGETVTVDFRVPYPPRHQWTRTVVLAWADNAAAEPVYSKSWYTG